MKRLLAFATFALAWGLLLAPGALALDTFEPNDTFETAHPIEFPADFQSYISTENDVDRYRVWLDPGPIRMVISPPATYAGAISLRDSEEDLLASNRTGTYGQPVELTYSVTQAGFYYVSLGAVPYYSWEPGGPYDYENPYTLSLSAAPDTLEPNDTFAAAYSVALPMQIESYISTENDVDRYRVWLDPGPIRMVISPPATYAGAISLRDSEEDLLASNRTGTYGQPVELTYSVTQAGFYYVSLGAVPYYSWEPGGPYDYENPYTILFDGQGIGKLPTELGLVAPGTVDSGTVVRFLSVLTCDEYTLAGKPFRLEQSSDGITGWSTVADLTSDTELVAHDATPPSTMWYRLVFDGDATFRGSVGTAYKVVVNAGPGDPGAELRVISVAGGTRYDTAVAASLEAYPDGLDSDGARTVIIATGRNWPDALGGTALAGVLNGPILLVDTSSIPAAVITEINRLGATKAIILGGPSAVGVPVENSLKSKLGNANVTRIAGGSRYSTADQVAARTIELLGETYDGTAFVATGAKFPDALAAAPLAAAKGWPLFLAHPTEGLLPDTVTAMGSVSRALILGGEDVVSSSVHSRLRSAYGSENVVRLAGPSRYDTAAVVAGYGTANAGLYWDRVGIATGQKFPDALAGGVLQGRMRSVMLLTRTDTLEAATLAALSANKTRISAVTFFGSTGAVSQVVRNAVQQVLQ